MNISVNNPRLKTYATDSTSFHASNNSSDTHICSVTEDVAPPFIRMSIRQYLVLTLGCLKWLRNRESLRGKGIGGEKCFPLDLVVMRLEERERR